MIKKIFVCMFIMCTLQLSCMSTQRTTQEKLTWFIATQHNFKKLNDNQLSTLSAAINNHVKNIELPMHKQSHDALATFEQLNMKKLGAAKFLDGEEQKYDNAVKEILIFLGVVMPDIITNTSPELKPSPEPTAQPIPSPAKKSPNTMFTKKPVVLNIDTDTPQQSLLTTLLNTPTTPIQSPLQQVLDTPQTPQPTATQLISSPQLKKHASVPVLPIYQETNSLLTIGRKKPETILLDPAFESNLNAKKQKDEKERSVSEPQPLLQKIDESKKTNDISYSFKDMFSRKHDIKPKENKISYDDIKTLDKESNQDSDHDDPVSDDEKETGDAPQSTIQQLKQQLSAFRSTTQAIPIKKKNPNEQPTETQDPQLKLQEMQQELEVFNLSDEETI